jgi:hypothetical protein
VSGPQLIEEQTTRNAKQRQPAAQKTGPKPSTRRRS